MIQDRMAEIEITEVVKISAKSKWEEGQVTLANQIGAIHSTVAL